MRAARTSATSTGRPITDPIVPARRSDPAARRAETAVRIGGVYGGAARAAVGTVGAAELVNQTSAPAPPTHATLGYLPGLDGLREWPERITTMPPRS